MKTLLKPIATIIFLVSFYSSIAQSEGQLIINSFEPTQTFKSSDLLKWVQVITSGAEPQNVHLQISLNHFGGQKIVSFQAKGSLPSGGGNAVGLEILNLEESDVFIADIVSQLGYYPEGNYTLCVTNLITNEQECVNYKFKNKALLELAYPLNEEEVEMDRPYFNWIYSQYHEGISFNIMVKEKREGQSNVQALELNPPKIFINDHPSLFLPYPPELDPIEKGNSYVWQVEVLLNKKPVGKSEIWSFYLSDVEKPKEYPISRSYVDLDKITTPPSLYIEGDLKFKTLQKSKEGQIFIKIINDKGKEQKLSDFNSVLISPGENYYVLKLDEIANLKHLKNYKCELESPLLKTNKLTILFTYIDPKFSK